MAGRPPKGGGVEISTERTRARRPRAAAEAAAGERMLAVVAEQAQCARVFALHGGPVDLAGPPGADDVPVAGELSVVLDWYRAAGAKRGT